MFEKSCIENNIYYVAIKQKDMSGESVPADIKGILPGPVSWRTTCSDPTCGTYGDFIPLFSKLAPDECPSIGWCACPVHCTTVMEHREKVVQWLIGKSKWTNMTIGHVDVKMSWL